MTATALAVVPPTPGLALYDRMCTAIAECVRVDEAKDIRDKAAALEAYYRQARNLDAEREAANVRLRAERRVGELLKELERADHADAGRASGAARGQTNMSDAATRSAPSPYAKALADQGMTRQSAARYQQLASIPKAEFERALSAPEKPTTAGVLRHSPTPARPEPTKAPVSDRVLWLWGRLRDLERDGYLAADPDELLSTATDGMRADVLRLAPHAAEFLQRFEGLQ